MASLADIIAAKKLAAKEKQEAEAIAGSLHADSAFYDLPERSEGANATLPSSLTTAIHNNKPVFNLKAFLKAKEDTKANNIQFEPALPSEAPKTAKAESFALNILLNEKQTLAKEMAFNGKSFCLIGAAGTGKTTTQREIAKSLLEQDKLGTHNFRIQGTGGERWIGPSIAFVAYTRIASGNLKKAIHKDKKLEETFAHNITTIHNLLEYEPEFYYDYESQKEKMRFIPKRTSSNPLDITHLIVEEASMVGLDLWEKLYDAMRPDTQIILLGDINQLPPVFGSSILNYALVQLPVVELLQVYRQKEGSSILDNAHKILAGKFPLIEDANFKIIRNGDVQHSQFKLSQMIGKSFPKFHDMEVQNPGTGYDPEQDIILTPFNKYDLGTDNLNKQIAQFLGLARKSVVYHVSAGITQQYLAIGDKVFYNKQVGEIIEIKKNYEYMGKETMSPSPDLSRFGVYIGSSTVLAEDDEFSLANYSNLDLDKMLESDQKEDLVRSASHHVKLLMETGEEKDLCSVGDFAPSIFSLGYALTVHKAQGCEWRKVFLMLHKDHSIMAFREILYTAVTRARETCLIFTKDFMIEKAIKNPRIKGNTLEEKIEYFNSGVLNQGNVYITKTY